MKETILDQALAWHGALAGDQADWDGFTRWLEADPSHREAFDSVALLDDLVDRHRPTLAALLPPDPESRSAPRSRRLRGFAGGGAIAAGIAALFVLFRPEAAVPPTWYATANLTREIALADGSRVALAASSRLGVAARGKELILAGTASFDVPHRPGRMLIVHAGGVDLQDIGTRFEVSTGPGALSVAVAEGRLTARLADGQTVGVVGGHRLLVDSRNGSAELRPFAPRDYAAWRSGRLVYDNAPLALVAADVARFAGKGIRISPDLSSRRFSGVLTIGDGSGLVRTLAQFMDLDVRPEGHGVRLVPRGAGGRRIR